MGTDPTIGQDRRISKSAGVTFQLPRGRDVGTALCQRWTQCLLDFDTIRA